MEPDLTSLLFDKNMESFMLKAGLKSEIIFISTSHFSFLAHLIKNVSVGVPLFYFYL